jgi:hypothetical protein
MKKIAVISVLVLFGSTLITCNDDNPTCPELSIEGSLPFTAPPNGPVLIKGTGFDGDGITLRFGTLKADILDKNILYISTKIPPGLLGVVELSVSNAQGCLVTKKFEVSSDPSTTAGSPPVYFIPPGSFTLPLQLPTHSSMIFENIYDRTQRINIYPFSEVMEIGDGVGWEEWDGVISSISGNVDIPKNEIKFKIDRLVKDDDVLIGGFYTMTLKINGVERKDNFLIAFSSLTGRQYVFEYFR